MPSADRHPPPSAAPDAARDPRRDARPAVPALLAILLGTTALALAAQWRRPLLDDEVGSMRAVALGVWEIATRFEEWLTQPAFFLLAKPCVALLGESELAIRLPALLASLGGLVALAHLGARLISPPVGLLAALLLASQPYALFYAQMGRGYALASALTTTSLLLLLRLARGAGPWTGVAYLAARAGGVYAHLGACGSGVAELAIALAATDPGGRDRRWRTLAWIGAGAGLSVLLYAPLLPDMLVFSERWTERGGARLLTSLPLVLSTYAGAPGAVVWLWAAAVLAGVSLAFRRSRLAGSVLVLWPLGIAAFYWLAGTAHYPWAFARFLFPALPALALALATALHALACGLGGESPLRRRAWLGVGLALALGLGSGKLLPIAFGPRDPDWPVVIERLERASVDPAEVFHLPVRFSSFAHYLARQAGGGAAAPPPANLLATLAEGGAPTLAGRRLAFLVDLVDFAPAGFPEFEVERFGATTLLLARADVERSPQRAVALTRSVMEQVVTDLERLPRGRIASDWVYWRIHRRHEHAFLPEADLIAAWAVLGDLARAQGDAATLRRASARVAVLKRELRGPDRVRASPSLLGLRFLEPSG